MLAAVWAAAWGMPGWIAIAPAGMIATAGWCGWLLVRSAAERNRFTAWRDAQFSKYERAHQVWTLQVGEHDRRERSRVAATALWRPLVVSTRFARVDVFGGTMTGWSALLRTWGSSLLAEARGMLVLDFTEDRIAAGLVAMASIAGHPARTVEFPDAPTGVSLLQGLAAPEVGEVIAESLWALRRGEPGAEQLRGLDAELIESVAACLSPRITFSRLAAGLRLLRRIYDAECESVLSAAEIRRINSLLDSIGAAGPAHEELRFLTATLGMFAEDEPAADRSPVAWPQTGLTVFSTVSPHPRRKRLIDQLLFHRVLHAVRCGRPSADAGSVLVVAGVDDLGLPAVEALTRQARRAGVRLVVLVEHLRGELTQLLGGSDSASILMRMGNAAEAAQVAEFVGRGFSFVLSQYTEQFGQSTGESTSDTHGDSVTSTTGANVAGTSVTSTDSVAQATSWSRTISWSQSDSTSTARTVARAYEYTMEPTTFQSLPATAFVLVDTSGRDRRVVAGDCNPDIALSDQVADGGLTGGIPRR
ncbi:hypothetical protein ACIA8C_21595 [Nocardia sp. NPDC051321]|uniref:hypothetical protein n=1 Tax=Nocardia sp. NPDC051321 TaxID=3364323 RepID=UPI0037AFD408